jgi:hypothetical protein
MYKVPEWLLRNCNQVLRENIKLLKDDSIPKKKRAELVNQHIEKVEHLISLIEDNYVK